MAFEIKKGTFSLWHNSFKEKGDLKPDLTGRGKLESGEEVELAVWEKTTKDGSVYYSGSIKAPFHNTKQQSTNEDDEELPF
jgi:hypothetical protein